MFDLWLILAAIPGIRFLLWWEKRSTDEYDRRQAVADDVWRSNS